MPYLTMTWSRITVRLLFFFLKSFEHGGRARDLLCGSDEALARNRRNCVIIFDYAAGRLNRRFMVVSFFSCFFFFTDFFDVFQH